MMILPNQALLTVEESANFLRVSTRLVQKLCADGQLASVKVGKAWRIGRESLLRYAGIKES